MKKMCKMIIGLSIISLSGCQNPSNSMNSNQSNDMNNKNNIIVSNNLVENEDTALDNNIILDMPIHIDLKQHFSFIIEDDSYIYYCSKEGINRVDKKTGKPNLILKQTNIKKMIVFENYIYFVKSGENYDNVGVFRIDKNGDNYSQVFDINQINNKDVGDISDLLVIGNKLYLDCSMYIYSYDMEVNQLQLIVDDAEKFYVAGDNIYYIDHAEKTFTIYKKNLKTMKTQIALGQGKSYTIIDGHKTYPDGDMLYSNFIFIGNKMYFIAGPPTLVYFYNSGNPIVISHKQSVLPYMLLEYRGDVYYLEEVNSTEHKLMKFNTKNKTLSQAAVLKNYFPGRYLTIVNGHAYYDTQNDVIESIRINYKSKGMF